MTHREMPVDPLPGDVLIHGLRDARARTLDLISDLSTEALLGPRLAIVNPPLWEIGHVAWFSEHWILRRLLGEPVIDAEADALYNSAAVAHDTRWDLPLPDIDKTLAYMARVEERICERIAARPPDERLTYYALLATYHEDMHTEAFTYTRQTCGYAAPRIATAAQDTPRTRQGGQAAAAPADVDVPAATYTVGASPDEGEFVFDNEKWAHTVKLPSFRIARDAVTASEFAAFVDDGGYARREWWSPEGWTWREKQNATGPVYWRRDAAGRWQRRHFDRWLPLEPRLPVIHVNWFEADAYCRWAGRRLPSEPEWEVAASAVRGGARRRYPWGDAMPCPKVVRMDWRGMGPADVDAFPDAASAFGCRQMMGNVWEWTASDFGPYPGFEIDPYKEYSEPWFGNHKVLRGGAWVTRSRLIRNTWRNFYTPDRRDVLAGFRTCALE